MGLKDRVTVIAGANGGLGQVLAKQFAEQGARLALFSRNIEALDEIVSDLALGQDRYVLGATDLSSPQGAQSAADAVIEKFGRADILLNVVGGWTGGKTVLDASTDEVSGMLDQHVWTTWHLAQALVPRLVDNGWGRIVAVSQPFAMAPPGKNSPYAIGKAGQEVIMLSLANELKGTGVTSNVVLVRSIDMEHKRDTNTTPANASHTTPEEIAAGMLYLCSDEAGMVNGARIPMYGSP